MSPRDNDSSTLVCPQPSRDAFGHAAQRGAAAAQVDVVNILVAGGAGFLGSHLVDRLLAEGHHVDVVDDLSTGTLTNLAEARQAGGLTIHTMDVTSVAFVELVRMRQPEVIVHLAWLPPGVAVTPSTAGAAVAAALSVLEAARSCGGCKVVTTVSAVDVYGEVAVRDLPIKEGQPWLPVGVRGVLARTVVELLLHYRTEHAIEHTVLALGNVYGPRQRIDSGVVAAFASALAAGAAPTIQGDGRQTRDFLYVDDCVDAIAKAVSRGDGLVINIGSGVATSIRDLYAIMAPRGSRAEVAAPRPADPSRCALSLTRARIQLAWAPWTELAEGLRLVQ